MGDVTERDAAVDAEVAEAGRQAAFPDEALEAADAFAGEVFVALEFRRVKAPHVGGEADEFAQAVLIDVAVVHRVQDRQAFAVVAVGVGAELVFHVVDFEVLGFAHLDDAVLRHGRSPHDVAARIVVFRVLEGGAHVANQAAHQGFGNVIGDIVFDWEAEVGLHDVGQDVEGAGPELANRHGERVGRVHQREFRVEARVVAVGLDFLLRVGEDGGAVDLAAGRRHGDNHAQWQWLEVEIALHFPEVRPDVAVVSGGQGDGFAAVHDAAAADCQYPVHLVVLGQLRALQHLIQRRVRHDAAELDDLNAGFLQDGRDFIVDAVLLDGAAAVAHQDLRAVLLGQLRQVLGDNALAEVDFGAVLKYEIVHCFILLSYFCSFCFGYYVL